MSTQHSALCSLDLQATAARAAAQSQGATCSPSRRPASVESRARTTGWRFWGDFEEDKARQALNTTLWRIHRVLGETVGGARQNATCA